MPPPTRQLLWSFGVAVWRLKGWEDIDSDADASESAAEAFGAREALHELARLEWG